MLSLDFDPGRLKAPKVNHAPSLTSFEAPIVAGTVNDPGAALYHMYPHYAPALERLAAEAKRRAEERVMSPVIPPAVANAAIAGSDMPPAKSMLSDYDPTALIREAQQAVQDATEGVMQAFPNLSRSDVTKAT